jgi:hypothetical protein
VSGPGGGKAAAAGTTARAARSVAQKHACQHACHHSSSCATVVTGRRLRRGAIRDQCLCLHNERLVLVLTVVVEFIIGLEVQQAAVCAHRRQQHVVRKCGGNAVCAAVQLA